MRASWKSLLRSVPTVAIAILALAGSGGSTPKTFVSLWRAPGGQTVLESFSLSDGQPIAQLAQVPEETGQPQQGAESMVWLTTGHGPRSRSNVLGGDPEPDSCAADVARLDLADGVSTVVLSFPSSVQAEDAVPSPSEDDIAMLAGQCARAYSNEHLLIDDLRSGRRWTIGAGLAPCHSISRPSWNPAGTKLVFAYAPAQPSNQAPDSGRSDYGAGFCSEPRPGEVAIVAAQRGAPSLSGARLIRAPHGCSYETAIFDRWGIAAAEACERGSEPGYAHGNESHPMGDAYLVQLDGRGRVTLRLPLRREANPVTLSTVPHGAPVLVSQQQGGNTRPWWDWIWAFDGRQLRLVGHYNENVTAAIIQ